MSSLLEEIEEMMGDDAHASVAGISRNLKDKTRRAMSEAEIRDIMDFHKRESGLELNSEHYDIMRAIFRDHRNVFVTGGAGVGKTTFMRDVVIPQLALLGLSLHVTASTGVAGSQLKGKTLHSWAGIGLGPVFLSYGTPAVDMTADEVKEVYERTFDAWKNDPQKRKARSGIEARIRAAEVLIIDEVSMCPGVALLGYLDFFMRRIRSTPSEPFGGVQMLFVGDMAQLPPVDKNKKSSRPDWAFLCRSWREANVATMELTKVYRQADAEFSGFLNNRRIGLPMSPEELQYVRRFIKTLTEEEVKRASYLVTTNEKADRLNNKAREWYPEPEWFITAKYSIPAHTLKPWETEEMVKSKLIQNKLVKEYLQLRCGMPVMLIVNHPDGTYVNGSKAFVVSYDPSRDELKLCLANAEPGKEIITVGRYQFRSDERAAERAAEGMLSDEFEEPHCAQFPVIPATAITVHKSQGASLDECVIDLSNAFAPGHVYVAMSRLRTAEGLTLMSQDLRIVVDPYVMEFYRSAKEAKV